MSNILLNVWKKLMGDCMLGPLGVGTMLRLERGTGSTVERQRQATNEHASTPPCAHYQLGGHRFRVVVRTSSRIKPYFGKGMQMNSSAVICGLAYSRTQVRP